MQCTTKNLPPSSDIVNVVSEFKQLNGDLAITIIVVQKGHLQKKHPIFSTPGGLQNPSPIKFSKVIEEIRTIFAFPKRFGIRL